MILKRNTIEKLVEDTPLANKFESFCNAYDKQTEEIWGIKNYNFSINFGTLYYGNNRGETSFQFKYFLSGWNRKDRLIVVSKNDPRYKKIFGNDTNVNFNSLKELPLYVGHSFLSGHNAKIGDELKSGRFEFSSTQQLINAKLVKQNVNLSYANEIYAKQSDFVEAINQMKSLDNKNINFYDSLISSLIDNKLQNSFFSNSLPLMLQQIVIPKTEDSESLDQYIRWITDPANSDLFNNIGINFYKKWQKMNMQTLEPLIKAMTVMLVLFIVLDLSFIIFMSMSIMNENDSIVFILKALGYDKNKILWKMTGGYIISIVLSIIIGTILAAVILSALSGTFMPILGLNLALYFVDDAIALFVLTIVILPLCVVGISSYKITKRSLVSLDE